MGKNKPGDHVLFTVMYDWNVADIKMGFDWLQLKQGASTTAGKKYRYPPHYKIPDLKSMLCTGNRMDLSEMVRRWDFQLDVQLEKINNDSNPTRYTSSIPDGLGAYTSNHNVSKRQ